MTMDCPAVSPACSDGLALSNEAVLILKSAAMLLSVSPCFTWYVSSFLILSFLLISIDEEPILLH